jgi:hypothetical protein
MNLGALLLIACLALARWLPPYAQLHFNPQTPLENWSTLTLRDPKIGADLPGYLATGNSEIVLIVGDCGPCNASKVAAFSKVTVPAIISKTVFVASNDSPESIRREFGQPKGLTLRKLASDQRSMWNATFLPRVYAVDGRGKLLYIQSPSLSYGQGFLYAIEAFGKVKS